MIAEILTHSTFKAALLRARERSVTIDGLLMLFALNSQKELPALTISALRKKLQTDKLTETISSLKLKGYVVRGRLQMDRRRFWIVMTARGEKALNEIINP